MPQISLQCLSDLIVQICSFFFRVEIPLRSVNDAKAAASIPVPSDGDGPNAALYLHVSTDINQVACVVSRDCCSYTFRPQKHDTIYCTKTAKELHGGFFFTL